MIDCEANIEHTELVEPCVICLDVTDDIGLKPICSSSLLVTIECNCVYKIHRTCFEKWRHSRPPTQINLRCLTCGCSVNKRRSRGEVLADMITHRDGLYVKMTRCILYAFCVIVIVLIFSSPYD